MALPTQGRFPNDKAKFKHFLEWVNAEGREAEVGGTEEQRDALINDYRVASSVLYDWGDSAPLVGR